MRYLATSIKCISYQKVKTALLLFSLCQIVIRYSASYSLDICLLGEDLVDGVLAWRLSILERANFVQLLLDELLELGLSLTFLFRLAGLHGACRGAHGRLATSARHTGIRHGSTGDACVLEYLTSVLLGLLFLVIVQNLLTVFLENGIVRADGVDDHSATVSRNEQAERHVLVALDDHLTRSQRLEEFVNGLSAVVETASLVLVSALDDLEELDELNLFGLILVHQRHDALHLLPVVDQAKCNQRVLELVHTNLTRLIVIERVKVVAQQLALVVREVNVLRLTT